MTASGLDQPPNGLIEPGTPTHFSVDISMSPRIIPPVSHLRQRTKDGIKSQKPTDDDPLRRPAHSHDESEPAARDARRRARWPNSRRRIARGARGLGRTTWTRFADKVLMPGLVEGHSHVSEGVQWRFTYCGFFDRTDPDGKTWSGLPVELRQSSLA